MGDFIKKRDPFFKKEQLIDFESCKSLQDCIAWHMKHTPWFSDTINNLLGKEDWARKEEIAQQKEKS